MNAPATAAALAEPTLKMIALALIIPSSTHIQQLRRERFDPKVIKELAESIKSVGILQPPVARPHTGGKYELVAGERRYLAAKIAGLKEIPLNVRELTDDQVLEVQLVENLQREGLHAIEEAEGYDELMKLKKISADAVADMVGKSRSYVYGRTKLLALCPEIRKAFYAAKIDASTALELARITQHDRQREAFDHIIEEQRYGELQNFREIRDYIRDKYMLRLKSAPFDVADENLVPKAGSCAKCPKRTGNQADLFGDVKNADVCTDTKCFDDKRQAHYAGARKGIEAKGKKVIHGDAAKKLFPNWETGDDDLSGGYQKLSDHAGGRLVSAVVGKEYDPVLIQHPLSGKIIEAASSQAIAKASGGKAPKQSDRSEPGVYNYEAARQRRANKGPDVDEMLTERLAQLIHKNAPKQFGKAWLLDLTKVVFEKLNLRDDDAVAKAFGWPASAFAAGYRSKLPIQAEKLDEHGLVLLMFQIVFACRWGRERVQKLFGINEQKIREQIVEECKAAAKKEREEAKAKKAAKANKNKPVAKVNAAIEKREAKAKVKNGASAWPFPTGKKAPIATPKKPKKPAAKKAKGKKK